MFWMSELALADISGRCAVRLDTSGASRTFPCSPERIFKSFVGTLHAESSKPELLEDSSR